MLTAGKVLPIYFSNPVMLAFCSNLCFLCHTQSVIAAELDAEHTNLMVSSSGCSSIDLFNLRSLCLSLQDSVRGLQARLAVLDPSHITNIAGQLQLLLKNLKDFQSKAKSTDTDSDPEQKAKVGFLVCAETLSGRVFQFFFLVGVRSS